MRGALLLAAAFPLVTLHAHDIAFTVYAERTVAAVRWTYAGQDPVRFASIYVYSPADPAKRYQTGRTDANGVFAFVPDRPGTWRVAVDDEEGHKAEAQVEVGEAGALPAATPSLWAKWLSGIAAIAGVTGAWMAWRSRRQ